MDAPTRRSRSLITLMLVLVLPTAVCGTCVIAIGGKGAVRDGTVLELDLRAEISEASSGGLFDDAGLSTRDLILALDAASADPKVVGLFAHVGGAGHGTATAIELQDAVRRFRAAGKSTVAFAETFGELSPGLGGYVVASAFEHVWLQPQGAVGLAPLAAEAPFAKAALDKAGVQVDIVARKEFKSAPEMFTRTGMSDAQREATGAVLSSIQRSLCGAIAQARPVLGDAAAVCSLLPGGPYTAEEALTMKLVDKVGYRDEAMAAAKGGGDHQLSWVSRYAGRSQPKAPKGEQVGVVTVVGQLHQGTSNADPFSGSSSAGSDTIAGALRKAIGDDDIKAIILRIDSPGGSVVASETIAHEVRRAKAAGKPVIASMANVAGSGGYYIAMDAKHIVAQPTTITGSIGVYAGKAVTAGLWEQLGVNYDTLVVDNADASFFSTDEPYSASARARLERHVDAIYESFVRAVAAGRGKEVAAIEPVARGRIWSGVDAKERGLVDELGGWPTTLALTRRALGLAEGTPLTLVDFPKKRSPLEELLAAARQERGESSEEDDVAAHTRRVDPLAAARAAVVAEPPHVSLTMSPLKVLP